MQTSRPEKIVLFFFKFARAHTERDLKMSRYEIGAGGALRWSEGATVNERSMNKNAGMFRCSELAARRKGHRSGKKTAGL